MLWAHVIISTGKVKQMKSVSQNKLKRNNTALNCQVLSMLVERACPENATICFFTSLSFR